MNWVDSHRRVFFLRANWYCMRGISQQGLQHAFDWFSPACAQAGTNISSKKIELLCLLRRPRQCFLQVGGHTLQQVETFRYLGVVFTKVGTKGLIHGLVKKTQLRVSFIASWWQNGASKERKAFSFYIGLSSNPHLWSWTLGDDWKHTVKKTNGRDGIFAKSSRCDQRRKEGWQGGAIPRAPNHCGGCRKVPTMSQVLSSTAYLLPKDLRLEHGCAKLASCSGRHLTSLRPWVWRFVKKRTSLKSVKPRMSSHFSESRDPSYVSSAMCPECPRKEWRTKSFKPQSTHRKAAQSSSKDQLEWLHLWPCLLLFWCGARITIWNCCWSWGISSHPRAAAPAILPKGKASTKMSKWMSMYAYIFEPCYLWNFL